MYVITIYGKNLTKLRKYEGKVNDVLNIES